MGASGHPPIAPQRHFSSVVHNPTVPLLWFGEKTIAIPDTSLGSNDRPLLGWFATTRDSETCSRPSSTKQEDGRNLIGLIGMSFTYAAGGLTRRGDQSKKLATPECGRDQA
jgi:hypothetical protein